MSLDITAILARCYQLKDRLESDSRVLALTAAERTMNESAEVKELTRQYQMQQENYNYFWTINPDSKDTVDAQKALFESKMKLDNHLLVKTYQREFSKVRAMYDLINRELFHPFTITDPACKTL